MSNTHITVSDPDLFGNDAAELEDIEVFQSYALERPELVRFTDPSIKIQIVNAYKGEGKSALLRLTMLKLSTSKTPPLVISVTGQQLSPTLDTDDSDQWVRAWKASLLHRIACEVGSKIGVAWQDDDITLVEEAEQRGFRERSFVSTIFDRLKVKAIGLEKQREGVKDAERVMKRWQTDKPPTWIVVDDLDQNFRNTAVTRTKLAAFFTAVVQLVTEVPEFRFRLAIRPNTWATIYREFDSLSHVKQYLATLRWDQSDVRSLLAQRVKGYLKRKNFLSLLHQPRNDEFFISLAFESPMIWSRQERPPHVVLATLSKYRPRWLIELCKQAAEHARNRHTSVIGLADIDSSLAGFGKNRIDDTIAEFRPQCPQISELIHAFTDQPERYTTDQLLDTISRRVLQSVPVSLAHKPARSNISSTDVAAFLFEVGFLTARKDLPGGHYEHFTFSQKPDLLHSRANLDEGMSWEIHPVFRQVLNLKDHRWAEKQTTKKSKGKGGRGRSR